MLTDFDLQYADALASVMDASPHADLRTGYEVRSAHGVHFHCDGVPLLTLRDIDIRWPCAEAVWFVSQSPSLSLMRSFGYKAWDAFATGSKVTTAAGYRWGRQLETAVKRLEHDPSSRRCVLSAWRPRLDMAGPHPPCVPMAHLTIVDDRLCLSGFQRSGDMYFGVPHDVAGYAIMLRILCDRLQLNPGTISWTVSDAHVYSNQYDHCDRLLDLAAKRGGGFSPNFSLQPWDGMWDKARAGSRALVWDLYHALSAQYDRLKGPKLKSPKLVK